jgi:hypothetical protein
MSNVAVRASSWGSLFDCAYRFEGSQLLGLRMPYAPPALIGSAVHAGTAAFDAAKLAGEPISIDDAAGVVVDTMHSPDFDVDWSDAKFTHHSAENTALALHVRYCREIAPQFEYVAVEMQTKPLTIDCGGSTFVTLTGTLDRSRVRSTARGKGISDLKTGTRAVTNGRASTKNHRPQIGTYELLFEHTTGEAITEPGEIIGMSTTGSNEIATGDVHGARALMVGTEQAPGLIEIAASMFRSGLFPPNPQSVLCDKRYCPRFSQCPYHE